MTTKELIEKLQKMPQDKECLLAIDQSAGFPSDVIEVYPIEKVFTTTWGGSLADKGATREGVAPLSGYCETGPCDNLDEEKVLLYVFP